MSDPRTAIQTLLQGLERVPAAEEAGAAALLPLRRSSSPDPEPAAPRHAPRRARQGDAASGPRPSAAFRRLARDGASARSRAVHTPRASGLRPEPARADGSVPRLRACATEAPGSGPVPASHRGGLPGAGSPSCRRSRPTKYRTEDSAPSNPCSCTKRRSIRRAVCRCLRGASRSDFSHSSMTPLKSRLSFGASRSGLLRAGGSAEDSA
jgi:hypothetical protein